MEKQSKIPPTLRINDNVMDYLKQFGHERNLDKFMRIYSPTGSSANDGGASNDEVHSSCATQVMTAKVNKNSSCCSNAMNCDSFDGSCMQMLFDDELHSTSASTFKTAPLLKTHREEESDCTGQIQKTNNDKVIPINIKQQLENKNLFCASVDNVQTPKKIHVVTKCTQTPESIIKLHKRLEWDSFGDVGYKKSSSTSNINTLERSVLKEIFHDGSVHNHSNKSKVNASESDLKSLQNEQTRTPLASSTFVNLPHSRRGTQPKSTQTTFSKLAKMHDQSVQTSVLRQSMETQSVYVGSSATPSSFEYFSSPSPLPPPSTAAAIINNIGTICNQQKENINIHQVYNTQLNEMYAENMINQQNQSLISSHTAACADIPRAARTNADENEENIKKTQDKTDTLLNHQTSSSNCKSNTELPASDLDLGIKLLCSLVDAKSLGHRQKRELIKEIAKRISCIDCTASTNSTNTTTTTANTAPKRSNRCCVSPRLQENLESDRYHQTNVDTPSTNIKTNSIQAIQNETNNVEINNTVISESFERKTINPKRNSKVAKSTIKEGITMISSKVVHSQKSKSTMPSANVILETNKKQNRTETDLMEQAIMREWLDPMTQSEIEYEGKQHNKKKLIPLLSINKIPPHHHHHHKTPNTNPTMGGNVKIVDTEHRITQLNWIETEIKRLEDLRVILSKDSKEVESKLTARNNSSVSNIPNKLNGATSSLSGGGKREMQKKKNLLSINDQDEYHVYDSVIEDKELVNSRKSKTHEKISSRFDKIALSSKSKESNTKIIPIQREPMAATSDNVEVEKIVRNAFQAQRAKVPTPTQSELSTESSSGSVIPVESVCSLVQQRKREFMEHYNNKKRKQLELLIQQQQQEEEGTHKSCQQDIQNNCHLLKHCQHVVSITKRCSKRCCICINTAVKNNKKNSRFVPVIDEEHINNTSNKWPSTTNVTATATSTKTTTTTTTTLATMTNVVRSSSRSSSSDNNTNSKSGSSIVQNSISISKTSSIFGVSSDISIPMGTSYSGGTTTVTSTTHQYDDVAGLCAPSCRSIGVQTSTFSMQQQQQLTQPAKYHYYQSKGNISIAKQTKTNFVNVNNLQSACVQVRPRGIAYSIEFTTEGHTFTTHMVKVDEAETRRTSTEPPILSLQDHLQRSRPNFCAKSKERKSILNRMQILRAKRKKELESIIENTSFTSLDHRLETLPPPATSCIRVFSTREMKALTSKRCEILPEVVERQQRKKEENRRRNNRILRDIFNNRLQRRVRSGKISLNHSLTII